MSLTVGELAAMALTQAAAMLDECELLQRVEGAADAYGVKPVSYTVTTTTTCGLSHSQTNSEAMGQTRQDTQVPVETRQLRLPLGAVVDHTYRVCITKRFGVAIVPVTYEVVGDPQRGPSGLLVQIKAVTE